MAHPPHIAYVAWGFPPSRSGGTYRQLATANALAAAGWDVSVLTVDRAAFTAITGADESLEARIDPRVKVLRTRFDWPLRNQDRSTWPLRRRVWPGAWAKARAAYERMIFPEVGYAEWLATLRGALAELHQRRPIDLALATGNPHVAFAAAHDLHRSSGVPYVMEYRDAWLLDVFTGRQAYSDRSRPARLERRFIAAAAQTWFINQDILDWHAARYPAVADRFRLVPNGWDPELLGLNLDDAAGSDHPDGPGSDGSGSDGPGSAGPGCGQPGSARSGSDRHGSVGVGPGGLAAIGSRGQPLTFGYLGTISANAPMPEVVAGWRAAKAAGLLPPDSVLKLGGYLGYFGGSPDPSRDPVAAAVLGAEADGVEYVGPVDKAAVGAFYGSLDALVLPIKAGRYVTSGKVYEYIATGKPIVSIHPPEAGASRVLEGYPLWAPVADMTADQAATAFGKGADLVRGLTPELTAEALAFGERFTRQRQLGPAIDGLANLLPR